MSHEELTIKTPTIVKNHLIDSGCESENGYNIIDISIKLYFIIEQIVSDRGDSGRERERIIKTLLTVVNTDYGINVLQHLHEYGAYTYRELQLKLGVSKSTIHYITDKLIFLGLVRRTEVKPDFKPSMPGPPPYVWLLKGISRKFATDCMYRHYSQIDTEKIDVVEVKHTDKIEDTLGFYRDRYQGYYSNIPPTHLTRYLKETYPDLESQDLSNIQRKVSLQLHKEGKD